MNQIKGLFLLSRPLNLFIVTLSLSMLHSVAFQRMYYPRDFAFGFNSVGFALFVIASLLALAAGNLFNDLNDKVIDLVNRPDKKILDVLVSSKLAFRFAWFCNILGLLIAFWLSFQVCIISLFALYLLAVALLYIYSSRLKPVPFLGNIVVAFLSALVIFSLWIFDMYFSIAKDTYELIPGKRIMIVTLFYCGFAFFVSLLREVVKDMADRAGDQSGKRSTLALVLPEPLVRFMLVIGCFLMIAGVFVFQRWLLDEGFWLPAYALALVQIMMLVLILKTITANDIPEFNRISSLLKWVMLIGIGAGYLFLF